MGNNDLDQTGVGGGVRAVFLDRDGVINDVVVRDGKPYPPSSLNALSILPGVPETLAALHVAGLRLIVVTNQPDVASGIQQRHVVEEIHDWLARTLPIDEIKVCFHVDSDGCGCRKPRPGMLETAATEWGLNLEQSFLVGDRWRDIEAGHAAGCQTLWIDRGYGERKPEAPDHVVSCLTDAGRIILNALGADRRGIST